MLIRRVLESFVKYHDEAKAIGGQRFFEAEPAFEGWINERSEIAQLLNKMVEQNKYIQQNSKSEEVKWLSLNQLTMAKMMNLTHKNLL